MLKDSYTKWEYLIENASVSSEFISEYLYMKNPLVRCYFSIINNIKSIYLEFTPHYLDDVKIPSLVGLDISIESNGRINKNKKYIKIKGSNENDDIFFAFSSTLADSISLENNEYAVIDKILEVIKNYKKFFTNSNKSLSEFEEQGLFAELSQLQLLLEEYGDDAVLCWCGPQKNKRDFVFDDKSIEVKSTIGQINPSITISNELQLDSSYPNNINLFLKVFILEKRDNGEDINTLISKIYYALTDERAKSLFKMKLLSVGVKMGDYSCKSCYSIENTSYYRVEETFPKLTRKNIADGIFHVSYKIPLNILKGCEVNE